MQLPDDERMSPRKARRHFLKEKKSLQLPATRHHSCEANNPKARIKKLIAEEATERSVGTCTVASDLSCFTISGKKAGMSAPVKLALRPWHFCLE
ncbi:hypothetical protein PVAP13_5NG436400 [Panicum virgatum]|uniref:Uncharacterized protein n=1 Tax=Panicum virgatum TaxID=38727 RepID=A0A8T0S382_PANVG|nr:hypothetical protein PVAP13_5NG436400 [Panicum virgatum]